MKQDGKIGKHDSVCWMRWFVDNVECYMIFDRGHIHRGELECIRVFDFITLFDDIPKLATRAAQMKVDYENYGVIAEPRENGGLSLVKWYHLTDERVRWALKPGAKRVGACPFELHPEERIHKDEQKQQ